MSIKPYSMSKKILSAALSSTGSRIILPDIKGWDGNDVTAAELGTVHYAVIQDFNKTKMEIFEIDPSTLTVATTTGLLILKRKLAFNGALTETETSYDWTPNESYVLLGTNPPQIYADLVDLNEVQTITAVKTFTVSPVVPTPTTDYQVATKKYADDLSYLGAPDMDESTKGVGEAATQAETDAGDDTGTTTAPTVLRPSKAANSVQRGTWLKFTETASGDDAYTGTTMPSVVPEEGTILNGTFATGNTGACSFDANGAGVVNIKKYVAGAIADPETGDIIAGQPVVLRKTGSNWVLMNPSGTMPTTAILSEMAAFFAATDITGAEAEGLTGGGLEYIASASNNLRLSADTNRLPSNASYTKVKEIVVVKSGVHRIKFDLKYSGSGGNSIYGRVYKNGVAYGTEQSTVNAAYQTYSEDLWLQDGDKVQIYAHDVGASLANVANFRLYFDLAAATYGQVLTD